MGFTNNEHLLMYCDSQMAIHIVYFMRPKHVEVDCHYIRQCNELQNCHYIHLFVVQLGRRCLHYTVRRE